MRVAVICESSVDEEIIRALIDAILGDSTSRVLPRYQVKGWPHVITDLPNLLPGILLDPTIDALSIIADSNGSAPPGSGRESPESKPSKADRMRRLVETVEGILKVESGRASVRPLRIAIGIAVPAIEAWCLPDDETVSESSWLSFLETNPEPFAVSARTRELKRRVYGKVHGNVETRTPQAIKLAARIAKRVDTLERKFPGGFGPFARAIRAWRTS